MESFKVNEIYLEEQFPECISCNLPPSTVQFLGEPSVLKIFAKGK
jgi:hypothetical protein